MILRTSENPFECKPDDARPSSESPARIKSIRGRILSRSTAPTPWHLCRLAAYERRAGLQATVHHAPDEVGRDVDLELAAREVIKEEQRFRALHNQVVDVHGHKVNPHRVVDIRRVRDLELGPDAVRGRYEDRVTKAGGLEVE
ncbi:hypothetical protein BC936DRAFT_142562 [Jimgerdemannia flammicorona]|uniref:Uncharacterized protein n=2 Tax=Jimgerdemannia flammicorona TaxID=994334 RepID=A0A433DF11_9FUNG|nr:hypothetical protein BC936DRAFT_142562 [Jimgerdemannia flammicorona]RUS30325.1 hypothetical protein BC938DRAFT_479557 [Jimgerdemannia flammicorona]